MVRKSLSFLSRVYAHISDIHLEKWLPYHKPKFRHQIPPEQTYGILMSGDIGYPHMSNYRDFLHMTSNTFPNVYLISGNHEYDKASPISYIDDTISEIVEKIPNKNVYFLNNTNFKLSNSYSLLGTTLWSQRVKTELFEKNVEWLKENIEDVKNNNKKCVVMTHHTPSKLMIEDFYIKKYKSHRNFYSNLEYLIDRPISHWICGHSHSIQTVIINNIEVHMNCFGNPVKKNTNILDLNYIKLDDEN